MSSDKENEGEKPKKKNKQKHPGGPLQRSGKAAESWNAALGSSLAVISHLLLPTNRTLLRRYRFLRMEHNHTPIMDLAHTISREVIDIWNRARIPFIDEENVAKQLKKLLDWWNKSAKKCSSRMGSSFQDKLDSLFDIARKPTGRYNEEKAHAFLKDLMQSQGKQRSRGFENSVGEQDWTNDLSFYIDQKGPRLQTMGAVDRKMALKEAKKAALSQQSSSSTRNEIVNDGVNVTDESSTEDEIELDINEGDTEYTPALPRRVKHPVKDNTVELILPPNAMELLSPLAYRLKLSVRQQTALYAGVVKVGGGTLKNTNLSVRTVQRQRQKGIEKTTASIKEDFISNLPPHVVLHWDGKKITYQKKKKKDERLAILGSFPGVMENEEPKVDLFFGAPLIPNGSGLVCSQTVADTISQWDITTSMIIGMCWDTTAANTGRNKGAAVLFESR